MTIWVTSDEHYLHNNIIKYCNRPFTDVSHMTEELIVCHNSVVRHDDEVWHLGDFSMSEKCISDILSRLNGSHILVAGNHDKCYAVHKKSEAAVKRYLEYGFKAVHMSYQMGPFTLNHLPYIGDGKFEDRFPQYRPQGNDWLLHGHIHELWKVKDKMINVGVDVWDYTPVSYQQLLWVKEAHE